MPTHVKPRISNNQALNVGDEVFLTALTLTDMDELSIPNAWLSNFVIDAYLELITRDRDDVRFVPCNVIKTFRDKNVIVNIWLQQLFESDGIWSVRFWLIPAHLNNNHWALAVFDVNMNSIVFCDSLNSDVDTEENSAFKAILFNFFAILYAHSLRLNMNQVKWINRADIPAQMNSWDCGVFLLMYAEQIIKSNDILTHFNFDQKSILTCRARIYNELMAHRLYVILEKNNYYS
jgi:Ulp1 family protease